MFLTQKWDMLIWTSDGVFCYMAIPEELVVQVDISLSFFIYSDLDFCIFMNFYIISKLWLTAYLSKQETFGFFGVINIGLKMSFFELWLKCPGDEFDEDCSFIGLINDELLALLIIIFGFSFCCCCCWNFSRGNALNNFLRFSACYLFRTISDFGFSVDDEF